RTDGEAIGYWTALGRINRSENRIAVGVAADVIKQVGAIAHVRGGKGQRNKVGAHDLLIGDHSNDPARGDGAESRETTGVVSEVIENDWSIAHIRGRISQSIKVILREGETVGNGSGAAGGSDGVEEIGIGTTVMADGVKLGRGITMVRVRIGQAMKVSADHEAIRDRPNAPGRGDGSEGGRDCVRRDSPSGVRRDGDSVVRRDYENQVGGDDA